MNTKTEALFLVPVSVPWMISPTAPYLKVDHPPGGPMSACFVAYFRCEEKALANTTPSPSLRGDPGPFVPDESSTGATHRLVRVEFEDHHASREMPASAGGKILPEDDFSWTFVPSNMLVGESNGEYQLRMARTWRRNRAAPDPLMYEVTNSRWPLEIGAPKIGLNHFVLVGQDKYIEVLAKGWQWKAGQPLL